MSENVVFGGYTQAELDLQYNNRARMPQFTEYFAEWEEWSAETQRKLPARLDVAFGDDPAETLDIFPAEQPNAPVQIMIHGGYWYSLDKKHDSFVAEGFRPHGITTVVINYGLAPEYGMDEIVRQNRAACAWVWHNAAELGIDRNRIYTVGQSAGGHLVAMMMATDWPAFSAGLPADLIKGGTSISGIYDMEPIRLCYLNDKVGMSEEVANRNSPILQTYPSAAPLMFVSGDIESDEYARQAEVMMALWEKLGYPSFHLQLPGYNHFTMANLLRQPDSALTRAVLSQMGI